MQQGNYRTNDMYTEFHDERIHVNWKNIFIRNHVRLRVRFNLWLVLHDRLPTKDRLQRIGVVIDGMHILFLVQVHQECLVESSSLECLCENHIQLEY